MKREVTISVISSVISAVVVAVVFLGFDIMKDKIIISSLVEHEGAYDGQMDKLKIRAEITSIRSGNYSYIFRSDGEFCKYNLNEDRLIQCLRWGG